MSQRVSAVLWLFLGLIMGLVTLGLIAGGGYALWHTHTTVEALEKSKAADENEQDLIRKRALKPANPGRLQELDDRLEKTVAELNANTTYRHYAIASLLASIVPGFLMLPCFTMFLMRLLKKPRAPKVEDEEEEEEVEEEPAAKPKAGAKKD